MQPDPDPVAQAIALSQTILTASHAHRFDKALEEFIGALATIPDYAPDTFDESQIATLRDLAEQVIARIEDRVEAGEDSKGVQLQQVEAIYEIRRVLEEIYRRRQH